MNATTRMLVALGLAVLGLAGLLSGVPSEVGAKHRAPSADRTLSLDVACDCRTFTYNRGVPFEETVRGDGFIVNGKIFPAGTLPEGQASNDPNDPGSIGSWTCRGTQTVSFAEILAGAPQPHAFITQYHLLDDDRGLVSEGPTGDPVGVAAIVGGIGAFRSTGGDLTATIIGTNITDCPNIRFNFKLKKFQVRD